MKAARIIGRVVCSRKEETLEGLKLLLIQPLEWSGEEKGEPIVATDTVGAGAGEIVFWVAAKEAAVALGGTLPPVDAAVVGIVEGIDIQDWARQIE